MFGGWPPPGGDGEPLTKEQKKRQNIIAAVVIVSLLGMLVALPWLLNPYYGDVREYVANVTDVRIISHASVQGTGDDVLLGAVAGGVITGTWSGAAAGAVLGAEGAEHRVVTRLSACSFKVHIPPHGPSVAFFFTYGVGLKRCSLMREGDTIKIRQFEDGTYQAGFSTIAHHGLGSVVPVPEASP